jgi:hypothetical protein
MDVLQILLGCQSWEYLKISEHGDFLGVKCPQRYVGEISKNY